jgi:hypothetical protein
MNLSLLEEYQEKLMEYNKFGLLNKTMTSESTQKSKEKQEKSRTCLSNKECKIY